jgi:RNA polymerase-binding transcription factor DksA
MSDQNSTLDNLHRLRDRTMLDIERLREELQAEIEPASATDDDSADVAADVYERGKIISLIQNLEVKLRALENAIEKAKKGTYGICEKCGNPIPPERLEIMPETTLCVRCASEREQGIRRSQVVVLDQYEDYDNSDSDDDNDDDSGLDSANDRY